MRYGLGVFRLLLVFSLIAQLFTPVFAADWKMFQKDHHHTGFTLEETYPVLNLKWKYYVGSPIYSSPVVAAGKVYFGALDNKLYCLNVENGQKLWHYSAGNWIEAAPAVIGELVYFGSMDNRIYALDANTGTRKWFFRTGSWVESSPILVGNTLYLGSSDHYFYSLNPTTGTEKWSFLTKGDLITSAAYENNTIYFGSDDDTLYALSAQGQLLWKHGDVGAIYSAPTISDDLLFYGTIDNGVAYYESTGLFGSYYNKLIALDLGTGMVEWEYTAENYGYIFSSPAVAYGKVYFGTQQGKIIALEASTGNLVWEKSFSDWPILSSPAISNGVLYITSYDKNLYALNAQTGALLKKFSAGAFIHSSPAIAENRIFFGSDDGYFYCLGLGTPEISINLLPDTYTVVRGDTLGYTLRLVNNTGVNKSFQAWAEVTLPNGKPYSNNPILGPQNVTLKPGQSIERHLIHPVPSKCPLGSYTYGFFLGSYPNPVKNYDDFTFTVKAEGN